MRRIGWVLFALTCGLCAAETALVLAADVPFWSADVLIGLGFPLVPIGAMLGSAVGALIISRFPRNAVGWLFAVGQLGSAIGILSDAAILYVSDTEPGGGLPAIVVFGQLFNLIFVLTFLALIFLLVPDGRVLNRRWRFTPAIPITALVLESVVILTIPSSDLAAAGPVEFGALTTTLVLVSNSLIGVAVVLGAISVRKRLRAARGEARQQLRWLAAAAAVLAVIYVITFVGSAFLGPQAPAALSVLTSLLLYLSYIFVFVAVGIAILRYRLYDIDVILSRAIVLAVLAVFVTVGYIAVVVAIGSVLSAVGTEESGLFWPSLVATALVATAFQPLRRHVLRLADRLVYGRRAAPYEALADLSRELADRPTPGSLPARVAEATGRAVGAVAAEATVGPQPDPDGQRDLDPRRRRRHAAQRGRVGDRVRSSISARRSAASPSRCRRAATCADSSACCSTTSAGRPGRRSGARCWRRSWPTGCGRSRPAPRISRRPGAGWCGRRTRRGSGWPPTSRAEWCRSWPRSPPSWKRSTRRRGARGAARPARRTRGDRAGGAPGGLPRRVPGAAGAARAGPGAARGTGQRPSATLEVGAVPGRTARPGGGGRRLRVRRRRGAGGSRRAWSGCPPPAMSW